jgi:hypothetical protein
MDSEVEKLLEKGTESESLAPETEEQIWSDVDQSIEAGDVPDVIQDAAEPSRGEPPSVSGAGESAAGAGGSAAGGGGAFQLGGLSLSSGVLKVIGSVGTAAVLGTGVWVGTSSQRSGKTPAASSDTERTEQAMYVEPIERKAVQYGSLIESNEKQDATRGSSEEPEGSKKFEPSEHLSKPDGGNKRQKSMENGEREPPKRPAAPGNKTPSYNLSAERKLLTGAREALNNQKFQVARERLDAHESTFPDGQLAEQRDVLRIQILRRSGRTKQARREARRFLEEYPNGMLSGTVSKILSELTP